MALNFPAIPNPDASPEGLHATVLALKSAVELLTAQNPNNAAIAAVSQSSFNALVSQVSSIRTPGHIVGAPSNDSAAAGEIGENPSLQVAAASPIAISSGVQFNLGSIVLTPGNWRLFLAIHFVTAATTNVTLAQSGLSITSATLNTAGSGAFTSLPFAPFVPGNGAIITSAVAGNAQQLSAPGTFFGVGLLNFTVSTAAAWGTIRAWRIR